MESEPLLPFHLFDREADVLITPRKLPHWSQAGAICFITWRTHDSMPKEVLERWFDERSRKLRALGIDAADPQWRQRLNGLDPERVRELLDTSWNRWHDELDAGRGACVLEQAALASLVADSLHHFDGQRYLLLDFVVMPNHVHLLASFPDADARLAQCESWKHFTATQLNRRLGTTGRFWQQDGFDHLLRSEPQFQYLRGYIASNPEKAGLRAGQFVHYSRALS